MFFSKIWEAQRRCPECGELTLFHTNFHVDPTHPRLSYLMVIWKRCEYVAMNPLSSSIVTSKRIDLVEDDIPIKVMGKFQNHIYKYIKHSHSPRWKYSKFKHSHKVFNSGIILSVDNFTKN